MPERSPLEDMMPQLQDKLAELLRDPEKTLHALDQAEKFLLDGAALMTKLADNAASARETYRNFAGFIKGMGLSQEMMGALIAHFIGRKK